MEQIRKPLQGVSNIVRFNWHFYLVSLILALAALIGGSIWTNYFYYAIAASVLILLPLVVSLAASYYIYDRSDLYTLKWLDDLNLKKNGSFININAGFDEMSSLIRNKFPEAALQVFDFYDPKSDASVSIKRARKAYPDFAKAAKFSELRSSVKENSVDAVFAILSAHEIGDHDERVEIFKNLSRVLTPSGIVIVTEHLRGVANFLVYTVGAFHFLPRSVWLRTFEAAGFSIRTEEKITPFIATFVLEKNGHSS